MRISNTKESPNKSFEYRRENAGAFPVTQLCVSHLHMLTHDKIEVRVRIIRRVYLALTILALAGVLYSLLRLSATNSAKDKIEFLVTALFYLVIYIGLEGKKSWIIPFVLIVSAFGLFREFLSMLHPSETSKEIIGKIVHLFMFAFFWYQLQFFSKSTVKKFFGSKGLVFFQ